MVCKQNGKKDNKNQTILLPENKIITPPNKIIIPPSKIITPKTNIIFPNNKILIPNNSIILLPEPDSKNSSYLNRLNNRPGTAIKFIGRKITRDSMAYIFDSRKKPTFDKDYVLSTTDQIAYTATRKAIVKTVAKAFAKDLTLPAQVAFSTIDFSKCMTGEIDYLRSSDMYSNHNINLAKTKCALTTGMNFVASEASLLKTIGINIGYSSVDIGIDKLYTKNIESEGFLDNISLKFNKYIEYPLYSNISFLGNPLKNQIYHYSSIAFDYTVDKISNYFYKDDISISNSNLNSFLNERDFNFNDNPYDFNNYLTTDLFDNEFLSTDFNNDLLLPPNNLNSSDILDKDKDIKPDKVNINEKIQKLTSELQQFQSWLNICKLIKDIDDMSPGEFCMELETMFVGFNTNDPLVNGAFRFITDCAHNKGINNDTLLSLIGSLGEKIFDIPMTNELHFLKNLFDGKSVDEYLIPVLLDITTCICPQLGICKLVYGIINTIDYLLTKQKAITIDGIDAMLTDKTCIGFFKIRHKITVENDFFGIKIQTKSRHASDAKQEALEEFKRQLDYKVYEVIGIPIEFVNGTITKPTTRYGQYAQMTYMRNLTKFWLDINENYLTSEQRNAINNMYYETEEEKKLRHDNLMKGIMPSWYEEHKHQNILEFFKGLCSEISTSYSKNIGTITIIDSVTSFSYVLNNICRFFSESYHIIFDSKKCNPVKDPEKMDTDIQNSGFNNGKNKRTSSDNNKLNNERNKQRDLYNNSEGSYARKQIIIIANLDLLDRQTSLAYFVETGCSVSVGFIGSNISNIDREIMYFITHPFKYPFIKSYQYYTSFVKSYVNRFICDHATLTLSLLESTEKYTDEFLAKYINPLVCTGISVCLALFNYVTTWDKNKEGNRFADVMCSELVGAVNNSFGLIYEYFKDVGYIKLNNSAIWSLILEKVGSGLNTIININIAPDILSSIIIAVGFNLFVRLGFSLYSYIKSKLNPINNIEYCIPEYRIYECIPEYKRNPIISEYKRNPTISEYKMSDVIPEYKSNFRDIPRRNKNINRNISKNELEILSTDLYQTDIYSIDVY